MPLCEAAFCYGSIAEHGFGSQTVFCFYKENFQIAGRLDTAGVVLRVNDVGQIAQIPAVTHADIVVDIQLCQLGAPVRDPV